MTRNFHFAYFKDEIKSYLTLRKLKLISEELDVIEHFGSRIQFQRNFFECVFFLFTAAFRIIPCEKVSAESS